MKKGFVFVYIMLLDSVLLFVRTKQSHVIQLVRKIRKEKNDSLPNSVFYYSKGKTCSSISGEITVILKIVTYIDSMGCTGCKLQLQNWKRFYT